MTRHSLQGIVFKPSSSGNKKPLRDTLESMYFTTLKFYSNNNKISLGLGKFVLRTLCETEVKIWYQTGIDYLRHGGSKMHMCYVLASYLQGFTGIILERIQSILQESILVQNKSQLQSLA